MSPPRPQSGCWLGPHSSEGLTGAGGPASRRPPHTAVGRRPQFISLGFASIPVTVTLLLLLRTSQVPWVSPAWPQRRLHLRVSTGGGGRIAEGAWQIQEAACQMPPPVSFLLCKTGTLSRLPERSGAPNKRRREKPGPYSEQPKGGPIAPTNAGGPNPPSRNPADRPGPRRAPPLGEWEPVTGRTLPPPALLFLKGFKHLIYSIH